MPTDEINRSLQSSADTSIDSQDLNVSNDSNEANMQISGKRTADTSPIEYDRSKRKVFVYGSNDMMQITSQTDDKDIQQLQQQQEQQSQQSNCCTPILCISPDTVLGTAETVAVPNGSQAIEAEEHSHELQDNFKTPELNKFIQPDVSMLTVPMSAPAIMVTQGLSGVTSDNNEVFIITFCDDPSEIQTAHVPNNFVVVPRRLQHKLLGYQSSPAAVQPVPDDVEDFDRSHWQDPVHMGNYAMDIYNYLKAREAEFTIVDYMPNQVNISSWMRTLLVDWMVLVQTNLALNDENLYLAVKVVDRYLCRKVIKKEHLQLLGAAAYFIACKYDDRQTPLIEELLHLCDDAYNREELIQMEVNTLCTINFELGMPLAYHFMSRFASCARIKMPTLTLARFVLDLGVMDYVTVTLSDSKLAATALFIAMRMTDGATGVPAETWNSTLIYYSGYRLADFSNLVPLLNKCLHRMPRAKTILNKYSDKDCFEVTKVPLLSTAQLLSEQPRSD